MNAERVVAYIDGFNLYFGMNEVGNKRMLWLDVQKLSQSLMKHPQVLLKTIYFTSRISNNKQKQIRQNTYIEALETLKDFEIIYGQYNYHDVKCNNCNYVYAAPCEKMTDVNIACQILSDAFNNKYDTALLITGDSDLVPPVNMVHQLFPKKRIIIAFPPNRHTNRLSQAAKGSLMIGKSKILHSQFPDEVIKRDGFVLKRPAT